MKFLTALLLGLVLGSSASAATLISTASGNINATGTWSVVDTTGTNAYLPNDGGFSAFTALNSWATSDTSISMQAHPGWTVSNWFARDVTTNLPLGTVSSFASSLNLNSTATNAGSGGDLIAVAPANFGYTTLTTSFQDSASFNLASETVQGFGVKLALSPASGPTGTLTAEIVDASNANAVVCHQTVNIADLVAGAQPGTSDGGWVIFTCIEGTFVTNNAHNYQVWAEVSATTTPVALWTNGTAANFSRLVITTTTQSSGPAASDNFIVGAQLTGAGTHNGPFTVTINTTSNINYGSNANTWQSPSIAIGQYGVLACGTSASTNYKMEFEGPLEVYNGGTFSCGTNATPVPITSTATITLNAVAADDANIIHKNGGTLNIAGVARTSGKNVSQTTLTATANSGGSTLSVHDDTGWLSGDSIIIPGTVQPANGNPSNIQTETGTLSVNATSSMLTTSATLTNTHSAQTLSFTGQNSVSYSMPMDGDVALETRNVIFQGSGFSTPGYFYFQPNSIMAGAWARFADIGGVNTGQTGFVVDTGAGGSFSLTNSIIEHATDGGLYFGYLNVAWGGPSSASPLLVQNLTMYDVGGFTLGNSGASHGVQVGGTLNSYWTLDHILLINAGSQVAFQIFSGNGNITNITCADCVTAIATDTGTDAAQVWFQPSPSVTPVQIGQSTGQVYGFDGQTFGPLRIYAAIGLTSFRIGSGTDSTRAYISGVYLWNNFSRMEPTSYSYVVMDPYYDFEPNNTFGIYGAGGTSLAILIARNGFIGYAAGGNPGGIAALTLDGNPGYYEFDNFDLCPTTAENSAFQINGCTASISINNDYGAFNQVGTATVVGRNTSLSYTGTSVVTGQGPLPFIQGQTGWVNQASITTDCPTCSPYQHAAWLPNGTITNDSVIFHSASTPFSTRLTPENTTFQGYTSGYVLNVTKTLSGQPTNGSLISTAGILPNTRMAGLASCSTSCTATISASQTLGSSGSPVLFTQMRSLTSERLQSAPLFKGVQGAVVSGHTGTICVWVRESSHLDSNGADYAGDAPRLIDRANPAMGVATDTVLATFSGSTVGQWQQICGTTPTAPHDGIFEFVVDADETATAALAYNLGTPGYVNVADWSFSQN